MVKYWRVLIFEVLLSTVKYSFVESLECFSCQTSSSPNACNITTTCGVNEFCFMDTSASLVTYGCANSQQCNVGSVAGALVGRDVSSRQTDKCHECCSTNLCNAKLCVHLKPSACVDDTRVDCAMMNTVIGICGDTQKAKIVCPKFCNLCTLVDGQWSYWSTWSKCSVTCGDGTVSRTRLCENPAPANGGLDCVGVSSQTELCTLATCPAHGGWSIWSEWGSCSATCDVGMQRRDRSCSNPYPSPNGNPCFGDSRDDRICLPGACADGNWSLWGDWDTCSDSCNGGVKSRERTCTNPAPSPLGQFCRGRSSQTVTCNRMPCPEHAVAFTAWGLDRNDGSQLIFPNVWENRGNGYNTTTGRFTCDTPGVYYFSATLTKSYYAKTEHSVQCFLSINDTSRTSSIADHLLNDGYEGYVVSFSGTFHLNRYDFVSVSGCTGQNTLFSDSRSSFTGFLVTPDN